MRNKKILPYFIFGSSLFLLISLSKENTELLRGFAAGLLRNPWERVTDFKISLQNFYQRVFSSSTHHEPPRELIQELQLKNQQLEAELDKLQTLLGNDYKGFFDFKFESLPAKVIFRPYSTWNSSLWINVGKLHNPLQGRRIVVKNSPVMSGTSVIGVVDYVGDRQSRVRLITDSGLRPAVRAQRTHGKKTYLLAKGEIYGASEPYGKGDGELLQGIGFNYDFPDAEGPARDLRTGKRMGELTNKPALPILKAGDKLVTTGLDGVFPPGLDVAIVTKIHSLKEGDYYYELEAKPTAANMQELSYVFVIPPVSDTTLEN